MDIFTIDTTRDYETPEGIVLKLRLAGPVSRAYAWLIDFLIRCAFCAVVAVILAFLDKTGWAIMLILFFLIEWFYPVFFEVRSGSTPGKKTMNLSVIHDDGTPVHLKSSLLRNLIRAADFFPFCYGTGLVTMLVNRDFKRLGDIAAGTLVVYQEKTVARHPIRAHVPRQPPLDLKVSEQRTLLDLAERQENLSQERCIELAEILTDITGKTGEMAVDEIEGYANWLTKGRLKY